MPMRSRLLAVLASIAMILGPGAVAAATAPDALAAATVRTEREHGASRADTAALVAERTAREAPRSTTALLARDDDFPDALAAAGLAGALRAPVLLTAPETLTARTAEALDELGITDVVLLGGPDAIAPGVEASLARARAVRRIQGPDRYATAAALAESVTAAGPGEPIAGQRMVLLASGTTFADALAAGPLAAGGRRPLVLTQAETLTAVTAVALRRLAPERVLVLGGEAAVSETVTAQVAALGPTVQRVGGAERTATAAAIAEVVLADPGTSATRVLLARADAFPDALAAGPRAGAVGAPLLLTGGDALAASPGEWLHGRCQQIEVIEAVGGTAAIGAGPLTEAARRAGVCGARRVVTYRTGVVGDVSGDPEIFRASVAATLADPRGWALDGDITFEDVDGTEQDPQLKVLLASPSAVERAAPVCSAAYSCRVGDTTYINDERWRHATPTYRAAGRSLQEYRAYVVNHEVGHFLGLGHRSCPGTGRPAPVMQQQSIRLSGCTTTVWPLEDERSRVRATLP